ncbi:phospholipase D-like domain-containing protein [Candidatus Nesciobacter abundans]|nr:phospholipase D-like domain-containing protein [Candidatus Nesciobacter abundans]
MNKKLKYLKSLPYLVVTILSLSFSVLKKHEPEMQLGNVCVRFTPGSQCIPFISSAIRGAKRTLHIQAYSWTSEELTHEVNRAKQRGVRVFILLDKSHMKINNCIKSFMRNGIDVLIDRVPGIAHNKIIIADDDTVITGSFNFSNAAEHKNVENVLKIKDKEIAKAYLRNWYSRRSFSKDIRDPYNAELNRHPWKEKTNSRNYFNSIS